MRPNTFSRLIETHTNLINKRPSRDKERDSARLSNAVPGADSIRIRTTDDKGPRKCVYCQTAMAASIMHNDVIPHGINWRVIETGRGSSVESRDRDSAATGIESVPVTGATKR